MSDEPIIIERPDPQYGSVHQNGITDPIWPLQRPAEASEKDYEPYAGRIDRQNSLFVVRANVGSRNREELKALLIHVTHFIRYNQERKIQRDPKGGHMLPLDVASLPGSYRVTITLGFGDSLFVDAKGEDRFGLRALKPTFLKPMPSFPGDAPEFSPAASASDLIFLISSDHPYVSVAIARFLAERLSPAMRTSEPLYPRGDAIQVVGIEQGFVRPDKREFLRFDDGVDNLRPGESGDAGDLERAVYVGKHDFEPEWCVDGSYLVYRKIHESLPTWESLPEQEQNKAIGRDKDTGCPLSRAKTGADGKTPVFPDPTDDADGPLNAHIRKVQPRRPTPDLFGEMDMRRRFLRRTYPFFEGLCKPGEASNGLHFLAFMDSIGHQFEHVVNMWQMNENFPVPDTGIDAMYARGVLSTVDGGYYFCPPASKSLSDLEAKDFLGSRLLEDSEP